MKKYLILLLILISCQSKEERQNNYSKEIIDSSITHLEQIVNSKPRHDSLINKLELTEKETLDSNYIKLYYDYNKAKEILNYYNKEKILYKYERLKEQSSDLALKYAWDFYDEVEQLEIESLKSFYLLYNQKTKLIENRDIYVKLPLHKHNDYLKKKPINK